MRTGQIVQIEAVAHISGSDRFSSAFSPIFSGAFMGGSAHMAGSIVRREPAGASVPGLVRALDEAVAVGEDDQFEPIGDVELLTDRSHVAPAVASPGSG